MAEAPAVSKKKKKKSVAKEGWLHVTITTRGQGAQTPRGTTPRGSRVPGRRFCRLRDGALTISSSEADLAPLATIHGAGSALKEFTALDFTLTAHEAGVTREYSLSPESRDAAETKGWVVALADASLDGPFYYGWLAHAKEPRKFLWVLLNRGLLMWFTREQDPMADPRSLLRAASGFMRLIDYTAKALSDASLLITDSSLDRHGQPSARSISFTARSADERDAWKNWCDAERARHLSRIAKGSEYYGFVRMNSKSYLLLLSRGCLSWYRKIDDSEPKGALQVDECEFKREHSQRGGAVFSIRNVKRAEEPLHEVNAPSEPAASLWLERLAQAKERSLRKRMVSADELRSLFVNGRAKVAKQGWLLVQGRRRFVQLRDSTLVWFADEAAPNDLAPGTLKGSVLLLDSAISRSLMSFSVRSSSHKTHTFEAASEDECTAWVAALDAGSEQARGAAYAHRVGAAVVPAAVTAKQGWVRIKGKRRLVDLDAGRLLVLDEALQVKHVLPLLSCSAARVPPAAFLLSSLDVSYLCETKSADEAEAWCAAISLHVIRANAAAPEVLDKSGWLLLDGKSRWCAVRGGALHWFNAAHASDFVPEPRHCLPLAGAKLTMVSGDGKYAKCSFDLLPPPVPAGAAPWWAGRRFRVRAANESDAQAWATALSRPAPVISPSAAPSPVFGAPLEQLLAADRRDGRVLPDAQLPWLLRRVIDHLSTPSCLGAVGLYQAPGSFARVREWTEKAAKGADLQLREGSVHDVALLLRQFLRALPDPIVCRASRDLVLAARLDPASLRKTLLALPPVHLAALRVLLTYIHALQDAQERIKERSADVSVVFAPLLFGVATEGDENDVLLLQSVLTTSLLVQHGPPLLDSNAPLPEPEPPNAGESSLDALLVAFQSQSNPPRPSASSPTLHRRPSAIVGDALKRLDSLEKELAEDRHRRLTLSDVDASAPYGPNGSLKGTDNTYAASSAPPSTTSPIAAALNSSAGTVPPLRPGAHRRADSAMAPEGIEAAPERPIRPHNNNTSHSPKGVASSSASLSSSPQPSASDASLTSDTHKEKEREKEKELNAPLDDANSKPEKKLYNSIRVRVKSIGSKLKELTVSKDKSAAPPPTSHSARTDNRVNKDITSASTSKLPSVTLPLAEVAAKDTGSGTNLTGAVSPREERRRDAGKNIAAVVPVMSAEDAEQERFLNALKSQQAVEDEEQARLEKELKALLAEQHKRKQVGDTTLEDKEMARLEEERKKLNEEAKKAEEEANKRKAAELKRIEDEEKQLQEVLAAKKKQRASARGQSAISASSRASRDSPSSPDAPLSPLNISSPAKEQLTPPLTPEAFSALPPDSAAASASSSYISPIATATGTAATTSPSAPILAPTPAAATIPASSNGPPLERAESNLMSPRTRHQRAALPPDLLQQIDQLLGPSLVTSSASSSPAGSSIIRKPAPPAPAAASAQATAPSVEVKSATAAASAPAVNATATAASTQPPDSAAPPPAVTRPAAKFVPPSISTPTLPSTLPLPTAVTYSTPAAAAAAAAAHPPSAAVAPPSPVLEKAATSPSLRASPRPVIPYLELYALAKPPASPPPVNPSASSAVVAALKAHANSSAASTSANPAPSPLRSSPPRLAAFPPYDLMPTAAAAPQPEAKTERSGTATAASESASTPLLGALPRTSIYLELPPPIPLTNNPFLDPAPALAVTAPAPAASRASTAGSSAGQPKPAAAVYASALPSVPAAKPVAISVSEHHETTLSFAPLNRRPSGKHLLNHPDMVALSDLSKALERENAELQAELAKARAAKLVPPPATPAAAPAPAPATPALTTERGSNALTASPPGINSSPASTASMPGLPVLPIATSSYIAGRPSSSSRTPLPYLDSAYTSSAGNDQQRRPSISAPADTEQRVVVEVATERSTTERSVALVPGLTFEELLSGLARNRAHLYEIQDPIDGAILVGSIAAHFAARPQAPLRLRLVPRTLDL